MTAPTGQTPPSVRFHCTDGAKRNAKKSAHNVAGECATLKRVLQHNPERGVLVKGYAPLRKMRVQVPGLNKGKSGGYRAIYSKHTTDSGALVIFHAVYYKGDREDLDADTYRTLAKDAEQLAKSPGTLVCEGV